MLDICLNGQNTRNGGNMGIELDLHAMAQANMDLGVLLKTNIMGGVYMHCSIEEDQLVVARR